MRRYFRICPIFKKIRNNHCPSTFSNWQLTVTSLNSNNKGQQISKYETEIRIEKQIRSFVFWEVFQHDNFVLRSTDLQLCNSPSNRFEFVVSSNRMSQVTSGSTTHCTCTLLHYLKVKLKSRWTVISRIFLKTGLKSKHFLRFSQLYISYLHQ